MTNTVKSISDVAALLKTFDNIEILTHANPDGDTLGSGCALCLALRQIGKKANIKNSETIPSKYDYMLSLCPKRDFETKNIVSVDVADIKLLGNDFEAIYSGKIDLAIDHHETNRRFADNLYLEGDSASCCEIIFLLLKEMKTTITPEIASCVFTGVATDTGCFRFSNVTPRTHKIAAELIELGADSEKINKLMFDTKSFARLKLQRLCLENLELFFDGLVSVFMITDEIAKKAGCTESDFDIIPVISRRIEGVKIGVTLKEKADGSVKASLRSEEGFNSAEICAFFGGGGHERAAGCSFDCDIKTAKEKMIDCIADIINKNKQ